MVKKSARTIYPFFLFVAFAAGCFFLSISNASAAISNWQRGASIQPVSASELASTSFKQSLSNLKADNANYVNFVIPIYQSNIHSNSLAPGGDTPSDASIATAIDTAHSLGLKVSLKLHAESYDGQWRANIDPTDRNAWFASYGSYLLHYAQLGQAHGVEQLIVGTELIDLSSDSYNSQNTALWRSLIGQVRSVFSGSLVYAANWGPTGTSLDEKNQIKFWDLLDYVGIDSYYPLGTNPSDNSVADLRAYWAQIDQNDITPFEAKVGKPIIFTEIGYQSKDGAHIDPGNYQLAGNVNDTEQANDYEALFSYWNDKSYIAGVHIWDWDGNPNAGGPTDNDYTPQNKPAEATLAQWFGFSGTETFPVSPLPAAPSFTALTSNLAGQVSVGSPATFNVFVADNGGGTSGLIVDTEIYNSSGSQVYQNFSSNQSFAASSTNSYPQSWTPSVAGTYIVKVGVFNSNWSQNYLWNGAAGQFAAGNAAPVQPISFVATTSAATTSVATSTTVNQSLNIGASVTAGNAAASNVLFDLEIYNQSNQQTFQQIFSSQNFAANQTNNYSAAWTPSVAGTYTLKFGVFSNDWSKNYLWNNSAAQIAVTNVPVTPPTPPVPPADTTVPTVSISSPTSNSTVSGSSTQIVAQASDNVGVAGVQFMLDGAKLGAEKTTAPYLLTWDTTGVANGTHILAAVARDAAGNIATSSAVSITVSNQAAQPVQPVPPVVPPASSSTCPTTLPTNSFTGCYYSDINLTTLKLVRNDSSINFDWGGGSPDPSLPSTNFSVLWQGNFTFNAGTYQFNTYTDDGVRLYVDNQLVVDEWKDQVAGYQASVPMTAGLHTIMVQYYQHLNGSRASVNWTQTSSAAPVTPPVPPADTTPPSVPQNLSAQATSQTAINIQWNASSDNVGVTGYKLYRNGSYVTTTSTNPYTDTNLSASTTYSYAVSAIDAANNESAKSGSVTATTQSPPQRTIPPVLSNGLPTGTLAATTTATALTLSTDENAVCKYSSVAGTPYSSMNAFQTTGTETHLTTLSNLIAGTNYSYYIRCEDSLGNIDNSDYVINFSVATAQVVVPPTAPNPPAATSTPPVATTTPPVITPPVATTTPAVIDIWWPTNGATVSGSLPLKALVENLDVANYTMYWQVDGDTLNSMYNSYTDYQHKEADIDVSGWNWQASGQYVINFVAKDSSGNILVQKSTTITVTH
jgi:hypothetical protein